MSDMLLRTKLFAPVLRSTLVPRQHLLDQLNQSTQPNQKLILLSASAGSGKTTLVCSWLNDRQARFAWLSLDEEDSNLVRFLTYLIAALQTIEPALGESVVPLLQMPQHPPLEQILTPLLNQIALIQEPFVLVLDDYHLVDSPTVDRAITFLLDHMPPQALMVMATRQDPDIPLARYRARNQMLELRVSDLRFTDAETAVFLNETMGLTLSPEQIGALGNRTEGWVAGLQLAALSIKGKGSLGTKEADDFIASFTGSHHFVLDYLMQEVLEQQSEQVQDFLLHTSILSRLCGSLCDAVMGSVAVGQEMLAYLAQTNLFIIPLDHERRWYRYHHLFADLLRQRLLMKYPPRGAEISDELAPYHLRASQWYEEQGLLFEAFQHTAVAQDIDRAERLINSREMSLHYRETAMAILEWLASLPEEILDARPTLRVSSVTIALMAGQTSGLEEKLQAAEASLPKAALDDQTRRNLMGKIAAARSTIALTQYQPDEIIVQAQRALEYLASDSSPFRFTANWTLGFAHRLLGNRTASMQAYREAGAIAQRSGDLFSLILATDSLAEMHVLENELHEAAEAFQRVLALADQHPHPNIGETHLALARIYYEWNDLEKAEHHALESRQLLRLYDRLVDRYILTELFFARLRLAQGDVAGARGIVTQVAHEARQRQFTARLPDITAVQIIVDLRQGQLATAAQRLEHQDLPLSHARVLLAQGHTAVVIDQLASLRQQTEAKHWADERLKIMVLEAVAHHQHGNHDHAIDILDASFALAEPNGFIRLFVDEGEPMQKLLSLALTQERRPPYTRQLLAGFSEASSRSKHESTPPPATPLIEPLSEREREVLSLLAAGLSNREIGERLFLSLNTIKGHNRRIYAKLQVRRRTEAVARARELGLL